MQTQEYNINDTHNLYLNKYIDNQQTKSIAFMKLDSHRTLYRQGIQCKYLTNLVLAGRNFIQIYAIFQNQITLKLGNYHIYQDIREIYLWDKTIVIQVGNNKIIGLIYEDNIIKNSFMLSLEFLDLGPKQKIEIICDRNGFYLVIVTAREILLCTSQKCIQKYKIKPYYHRNSVIVNQDIKWNRPEYHSISDVIRIQFFDYEISKVQSFNFWDDKLYFIGYTTAKSNQEQSLFYIPCSTIFSDDQKQQLLLSLSPQSSTISALYPIHRGSQCQYLVIRTDFSIQLQSQKGNIIIQNQRFKQKVQHGYNYEPPIFICTPQNIFPIYVLFQNTIYIYRRDLTGTTITTASQIYKSGFRLPSNIHINKLDIKQHYLAYCNNYQVGLIKFQGLQKQLTKINIKQKEQNIAELNKIVIKQSFGSIIDFNTGRNFLIIQNYHKNLCRVNLLSKKLKQDPRPFVIYPKKNALQQLPKIKSIRSLLQSVTPYCLQNDDKLLKTISQFMIITHNDHSLNLYHLSQKGQCRCILKNFNYYTILPNKTINQQKQSLNFIVWFQQKQQLAFYTIGDNIGSIKLLKQINQVKFINGKNIKNYDWFLVEPLQKQLAINFYNIRTQNYFVIKLSDEEINKKWLPQIIKKNITFKKKDKDYFFLEVLITKPNCLEIWEVSVSTQEFKLSHRTEEIGEGLPILFNTPQVNRQHQTFQSFSLSHRFRSITCPQYTLPTQNMGSSLHKPSEIVKLTVYQHQGQSYLFIVNCNNTLMMYKKFYCCQTQNHLTPNNMNGFNSEVGFLYHRLPIQLDVLKNFQYNETNSFIDLGCGILRICNYAFYRNQLFQLSEDIVSCFEMDNEIWCLQGNGKIRMLITKGKVISHYLVTQIKTSVKSDILGLQSTKQIYVIYSRATFQIFNKQLNLIWKLNQNQFGHKQMIITLCAFDHYIAVSYYNYAENQQDKTQYQSIRFKLRIYNTILKNRIIEKEKALEQPALFIRDIPPDKLLLITASNIFVYLIKNDRTLQPYRYKNYTKRGMLSSFSYIPQKIGVQPGYMIFGGIYGGLSFMLGQLIDKEKLDEVWFESLKCGIKQSQIFHFGRQKDFLKAIIADDECNILVLNLKPNKLQKIADINLGTQITKIKKRNQVPYISCQDGCIQILVPLQLRNIQVSFLDFQEQIMQEIPFLGGLNTRDSRCLSQRFRTYKLTSKGNIVDSQIIKDFMSLTETLQYHIFDKADLELSDVKSALLLGI